MIVPMNPITGLSARLLSRRIPLAVVGAGAVLALAACGSSSSSSSSASASGSAAASSAATTEQSESPTAPSASAEVKTSVNPQYAAFCASYKTFYDSANKADTTPKALATQLAALEGQAPAELKADLTNAKTSLDAVNDLYTKSGAAAAGQKLASDPNYAKSVQAIVTWAQQNCGIVPNTQASPAAS